MQFAQQPSALDPPPLPHLAAFCTTPYALGVRTVSGARFGAGEGCGSFRGVRTRRRPRARSRVRVREPSGIQMIQSGSSSDYSGWSADFLELCRSQLDLLLGTIPDLTEAAVFFRRERSCGALEFVPIAVASVGVERIWIAHPHVDEEGGSGSGSSRAELSARTSLNLPGGVPAIELVPSYPAISDEVLTLPDGALCVPVKYNSSIAGNVVLWRPTPRARGGLWSSREIASARAVARSIAIAAALEGKNSALERARIKAFELMKSAHNALGVAMHQIRSPITALVTFGHVLLRELPPDNKLRQLAKSIVVEAMRLDVLLTPVENIRSQLALEASEQNGKSSDADVCTDADSDNNDNAKPKLLLEQQAHNVSPKGMTLAEWDERRLDNVFDNTYGEKRLVLDRMGNDSSTNSKLMGLNEANDSSAIAKHQVMNNGEPEVDDYDDNIEFENDFEMDDDFDDGEDDMMKELIRYEDALLDETLWVSPSITRIGDVPQSLLWLTDVVEPLLGTFSVLAAEAGHTLHVTLDRDAPAVRADADQVREAVYNLLHNAVSYTPAGGHVGVVVFGTHVVVWDTGVGVKQKDKLRIWHHGERAIEVPSGQGIGLAVVREAGIPAVCSPIPSDWDPRTDIKVTLPGSAFRLRFDRG